MYIEEIKIPLERVAVLVGKKGSIKKLIEKATHTRIKIDSKEGLVVITGKESIDVFISKDIVRAIARGFNPELALMLKDDDIVFETIEIQDFSGKSKAKLIRLRGRCIGEKGKSRRLIEELTDTNVSIYGKTIGILGNQENVSLARKAFESLLAGAQHGNIYKWLEKKRKDLKLRL